MSSFSLVGDLENPLQIHRESISSQVLSIEWVSFWHFIFIKPAKIMITRGK